MMREGHPDRRVSKFLFKTVVAVMIGMGVWLLLRSRSLVSPDSDQRVSEPDSWVGHMTKAVAIVVQKAWIPLQLPSFDGVWSSLYDRFLAFWKQKKLLENERLVINHEPDVTYFLGSGLIVPNLTISRAWNNEIQSALVHVTGLKPQMGDLLWLSPEINRTTVVWKYHSDMALLTLVSPAPVSVYENIVRHIYLNATGSRSVMIQAHDGKDWGNVWIQTMHYGTPPEPSSEKSYPVNEIGFAEVGTLCAVVGIWGARRCVQRSRVAQPREVVPYEPVAPELEMPPITTAQQ